MTMYPWAESYIIHGWVISNGNFGVCHVEKNFGREGKLLWMTPWRERLIWMERHFKRRWFQTQKNT